MLRGPGRPCKQRCSPLLAGPRAGPWYARRYEHPSPHRPCGPSRISASSREGGDEGEHLPAGEKNARADQRCGGARHRDAWTCEDLTLRPSLAPCVERRSARDRGSARPPPRSRCWSGRLAELIGRRRGDRRRASPNRPSQQSGRASLGCLLAREGRSGARARRARAVLPDRLTKRARRRRASPHRSDSS